MNGAGEDEEAAWHDLVARLAAPAPPGDGAAVPWPDLEELPSAPQRSGDGGEPGAPESPGAGEPPGHGPDDQGRQGTGGELSAADAGPVPGVIPAPPHIRVIRPAAPVPPPASDEAGDEEHFVPPPPPPLPPLDPLSKGAWVALFGGPGYLLVAAMTGWEIPGWALLCAVAAFVGGFATIVARMDDRPPGDSGPDNGAVV